MAPAQTDDTHKPCLQATSHKREVQVFLSSALSATSCTLRGGRPVRFMRQCGDNAVGLTVLTNAQLVAIMDRPGSRMSLSPDSVTRSRTVSMRSFGVGSLSPLPSNLRGRLEHVMQIRRKAQTEVLQMRFRSRQSSTEAELNLRTSVNAGCGRLQRVQSNL